MLQKIATRYYNVLLFLVYGNRYLYTRDRT